MIDVTNDHVNGFNPMNVTAIIISEQAKQKNILIKT